MIWMPDNRRRQDIRKANIEGRFQKHVDRAGVAFVDLGKIPPDLSL
jgi:hypothetical protein